jgi:hypothetical protein
MNIEKSTIQLYRIRLEKSGWADISIDEHGNAGRMSIASDWGSWEYYWHSCGMPFKEFLTSLNLHYVASKFREDDYINVEKTVKAWKKSVIEQRRDDVIDSDQARLVYDEIKEIEYCSASDFVSAVHSQKDLLEFLEYGLDIIKEISPRFKTFWDKIIVPFKQHLKAEIESAKPQDFSNAYSIIP